MESRQHRWSGWPGAWCLDCGCDDPREIALADGNWSVIEDPVTGEYVGIKYYPDAEKEVAAKMICPEPGSNRHNPYVKPKTSG